MDNATLALSQLTDVEICAKDARCVREPRHAGLCLIVEDPTARALKLADRLEKEAARLAAEAAAWRAAEEAGVEAPGCGRHPQVDEQRGSCAVTVATVATVGVHLAFDFADTAGTCRRPVRGGGLRVSLRVVP